VALAMGDYSCSIESSDSGENIRHDDDAFVQKVAKKKRTIVKDSKYMLDHLVR